MSRDPARKVYYGRDRERDRDRDWDRGDYRNRPGGRKRTRSPNRNEVEKRRSRTPRKGDKDMLDDNILNEISKLPEPSELWEPPFQEGGFSSTAPPAFQQEGVPNQTYLQNYQASYTSGIYDDFPTLGSMQPAHLPDTAQWNQMSLPPPPVPPAPVFNNVEDQIKKEAAIESEMRHQKAALSKQREDYIKKAGILKKELDTLKDQRNELRGDAKRSPSPDTKRFLKENTKLQLEIQNKLKTINNVVDMLNGIIGEEAEATQDLEEVADRKRKSRSPSNRKSNYVYYDPEMHWCRVCNEFPPTAKDYLNHLHSPAHHKMAAAHMEAPWHSVAGVNEGFPSYPSAPTKRTPIRGLQFFVPSTAWYCKLCDQFIGDLHCASAHLKSIVHSKNYTNFVEQNPHWETDWMSDRQKAYEIARASKKAEEKPAQYAAHTITFNKDGFHTKRKDSPTPGDDKKKKKDRKKKTKRKQSSSSSSSSDSSTSDSDSPKKRIGSKLKSKLSWQTQWMSSIAVDRLNHDDRKLLDNLKTRIKKEKEVKQERSRSKERADSKRREAERLSRSRESRGCESRGYESRGHESRGHESRGHESRGHEAVRREDRRSSSRASPKPKKPEIKKMPFIGKMPVYKSLTKTSKVEELKKDEQKKKEEEEMNKKRREEMDVEIQKKVAEFKEKIAKAQLERQHQAEVPSFLPLPTPLTPLAAQPQLPPPQPAPAPPPQQPPNLPKDFQEALDIIFPSEAKNAEIVQQAQELLNCMPGLPPGFPLGGVMPPFPALGLMQPPMFGFDLNAASLFPPRPQLYDTHVPLVPSPKPRPKRPIQNKNITHNSQNRNHEQRTPTTVDQNAIENGSVAKKKEHMDDLAMLGIDASDVGSGM